VGSNLGVAGAERLVLERSSTARWHQMLRSLEHCLDVVGAGARLLVQVQNPSSEEQRIAQEIMGERLADLGYLM
jgi:hypothetical protein